jgi:hypothetical protein
MTRLILVCFAIAVSLVSKAQKSRVYFRAGMNLARVSEAKHIETPDQTSMLVSYQVGFTTDIVITGNFSLQPSLIFTGKGSKIKRGHQYLNSYFQAKGNPFYVELPLNAVGKFPLSNKNFTFFVGAGPYIAFGVTGKSKVEGKFFGSTYSRNSKITFSNEDVLSFPYEEYAGLGVMRRIDYGLNGIVGLQYKRIFFAANYGDGKAELQKHIGEVDEQNKHQVISILVGCRL